VCSYLRPAHSRPIVRSDYFDGHDRSLAYVDGAWSVLWSNRVKTSRLYGHHAFEVMPAMPDLRAKVNRQ
jgi:hypothetical protein